MHRNMLIQWFLRAVIGGDGAPKSGDLGQKRGNRLAKISVRLSMFVDVYVVEL